MSLPDVAAGLSIANFAHNLYIRIKKRKKSKKPSKKRRKSNDRRITKDRELAQLLVTNPNLALKMMTAEYIVKHRDKLAKNIEDYLVDQFG
jgi:hypothetical protein